MLDDIDGDSTCVNCHFEIEENNSNMLSQFIFPFEHLTQISNLKDSHHEQL